MYWLILVRRIWSNDQKREREREGNTFMTFVRYLGREKMRSNWIYCKRIQHRWDMEETYRRSSRARGRGEVGSNVNILHSEELVF